MTPQEKFEERNRIIDEAISLREPFRVPCVPLISTYPLYEYGFSIKENMYNPRKF